MDIWALKQDYAALKKSSYQENKTSRNSTNCFERWTKVELVNRGERDLTVKHGGGGLMMLAFFRLAEPEVVKIFQRDENPPDKWANSTEEQSPITMP